MGQAKQLLPYFGRPLLRHVAETALATACERVVVVLGACSNEVKAALDGLPLEIIENLRWEEGIETSIACGVEAARDSDAVILSFADQPLISATVLNRLIHSQSVTNKPIVASEYGGTVGMPALFVREFFSQLFALPPSQGCKALLMKHAALTLRLPCPEAELDIDTPEDYERSTQPED